MLVYYIQEAHALVNKIPWNTFEDLDRSNGLGKRGMSSKGFALIISHSKRYHILPAMKGKAFSKDAHLFPQNAKAEKTVIRSGGGMQIINTWGSLKANISFFGVLRDFPHLVPQQQISACLKNKEESVNSGFKLIYTSVILMM